jgi:hypothetical protein
MNPLCKLTYANRKEKSLHDHQMTSKVPCSTKILVPRYYDIPKTKEDRGIVLLLSLQLD